MKKFNKILALSLIFTCFISTVIPASASNRDYLETNNFTESNNLYSDKTNVQVIQTDITKDVIYTYEQNGLSYKVIENVEDNLSKIHSSIYVKDVDGNYQLNTELDTIISSINSTNRMNESGFEIVLKENNKTIDSQKVLLPSNNIQNIDKTNSELTLRATPQYKWVFDGTFKGNNKIEKYTLSGIVSIIAHISGTMSGNLATSTAIAAANFIAQTAIQENFKVLYWTVKQWTYKMYNGMYWFNTGCKTDNNYYSNSSRTKLIKHFTDIDV